MPVSTRSRFTFKSVSRVSPRLAKLSGIKRVQQHGLGPNKNPKGAASRAFNEATTITWGHRGTEEQSEVDFDSRRALQRDSQPNTSSYQLR